MDGKKIITVEMQELSSIEGLKAIESIIREVVERLKNNKHTISFSSKHLCGIKLNDIKDSTSNYFNFEDTDLRGADLGFANLQGANLRDANLQEAYLNKC